MGPADAQTSRRQGFLKPPRLCFLRDRHLRRLGHDPYQRKSIPEALPILWVVSKHRHRMSCFSVLGGIQRHERFYPPPLRRPRLDAPHRADLHRCLCSRECGAVFDHRRSEQPSGRCNGQRRHGATDGAKPRGPPGRFETGRFDIDRCPPSRGRTLRTADHRTPRDIMAAMAVDHLVLESNCRGGRNIPRA